MPHCLAYVLVLLPLLGACQSMKIEDFKETTPRLILEDYFAGRTVGWGIFEDRFGNLRREFKVDIAGTWDGKTLTMVEDFVYSDGETDQRIWRVEKVDDHRYRGRADDVIGVAEGTVEGKALTWTYEVMLDIGGTERKVRFTDWLFLQDDEVLINRASVTKFGIELGTLTLFFRKPTSDARGKQAA
ncbi:DUF3833 domain-containing protein [Thalassobaculum sp.]|uniref:DUF3833 domain-containing protein n=1 Tax=Thalassobaculum sp. TaxID=2022740 RepID=UPI0032F06C39